MSIISTYTDLLPDFEIAEDKNILLIPFTKEHPSKTFKQSRISLDCFIKKQGLVSVLNNKKFHKYINEYISERRQQPVPNQILWDKFVLGKPVLKSIREAEVKRLKRFFGFVSRENYDYFLSDAEELFGKQARTYFSAIKKINPFFEFYHEDIDFMAKKLDEFIDMEYER